MILIAVKIVPMAKLYSSSATIVVCSAKTEYKEEVRNL